MSSSMPMTSITTSGVRRTPMSSARASMMVPWTVAMPAPPRVLPDTKRGAADRGDQHLAQEPEFPVPDDGGGREDRGEHHRHGQHAGVDEGLEADAGRHAPLGQRRQAGAEHEQEKQRLDQRGDRPQPVPAEPDQLPLPDDADGAQVGPQAVLGHGDPDLADQGCFFRAGEGLLGRGSPGGRHHVTAFRASGPPSGASGPRLTTPHRGWSCRYRT